MNVPITPQQLLQQALTMARQLRLLHPDDRQAQLAALQDLNETVRTLAKAYLLEMERGGRNPPRCL